MSHYYLIQLKANFVFSTLFNTKRAELYFLYFFQFYRSLHAYGKNYTWCLKYFASPFEINEFFE